ncbi:hypothetical protein [Microcoleus sp. BROC3]|uniref:hypothetical protein n=1 Tax=Microcoleus sp. BROC3 TaxID=3055323 RepID=UPI002FD65968
MGKQQLPAVLVLTLLHHPHRIVGTVGNTADPSPDAHTPAERARQAHRVPTAFSVSRNSFVRFSSMPITLIFSR